MCACSSSKLWAPSASLTTDVAQHAQGTPRIACLWVRLINHGLPYSINI